MKEQITQSMFNYLLKISNGQLLLSPESLEKVIGIAAKQQSALRKLNKFPIKYKNIGKLVFYSINDVIEYMLSGVSQIEEIKPISIDKAVIKKTRSSKVIQDVSSIFMMRSFASVLQEESQQLLQLHDNLVKYTDSFSLYEKLNNKLSSKNTTQLKKEF